MATLINEQDLRGMFDIHPDVAPERLTPAIKAASRRLRSMIGDAAYTDAADPNATNKERREDCQYAEAALAMHFAILGLNTQIRPKGLVKTERVEGETVLAYLTPTEVSQVAAMYLEQADEIARPWKLSDGVPAAQVEIVETDDGN